MSNPPSLENLSQQLKDLAGSTPEERHGSSNSGLLSITVSIDGKPTVHIDHALIREQELRDAMSKEIEEAISAFLSSSSPKVDDSVAKEFQEYMAGGQQRLEQLLQRQEADFAYLKSRINSLRRISR